MAKAAKTKKEDYSAKTPDELKKALMDARKEQFNLRFQRSGGQLENTAEIRKVRRNIARIKTFLIAKTEKVTAAKKTCGCKKDNQSRQESRLDKL